MTELQSSFSVNCIAIVRKRPKTLTLKDCIKEFVDHRHEVTIRRTKFDKKKAEERAHLLQALIIASDNIDEVVQIIKSSKTPQEAQTRLMERFGFDEAQAKYVVDMRLSQLTGLQQEKLHAE
jgi:DNA gyrase subunit A